MKKIISFTLLLLAAMGVLQAQYPTSKHVILIGLDGVGAYGFQRAATPFMNEMAQNGALSVKSRCILESSSSQNWMTMLTGAIPIQHGVTSNSWNPDNYTIEPALKNRLGIFPSIFDHIKTQNPGYKVYMYYEWPGLGRMFDLSRPDKVVNLENGEMLFNTAINDFFTDKPEFLFVDIDATDQAGHQFGHESLGYFDTITRYDALIGKFVQKLAAENLLDQTTVIITGDHGGIYNGHGGETPNEIEIPILIYGGSVTKGKIMEKVHLIADIAPTVAGLLGVNMPNECVGKFLSEAYEPATSAEYAPIPVISPQAGFYTSPVNCTIRADKPGVQIFYTLDGSAPTTASERYSGPIELNSGIVVKAIAVSGSTMSRVQEASYRIASESQKPQIAFSYYENFHGTKLPDFPTLGLPDKQGFVYELSLNELIMNDKDHFAIEFQSVLKIEKSEKYTFTLISDDGASLYIDNKLVVDNDGSHSRKSQKGSVELSEGSHAIRLLYFDDTDSEFLELFFESPSITKKIIPFFDLQRFL